MSGTAGGPVPGDADGPSLEATLDNALRVGGGSTGGGAGNP